MRHFSTIAVVLLAYVAPAFGVALRCDGGSAPYCCKDSMASASDAGVVLGVQCSKELRGDHTKCSSNGLTKVCCQHGAIDLFGVGLVTLCKLPSPLLSELTTLGFGGTANLGELGLLLEGLSLPGIGLKDKREGEFEDEFEEEDEA